MPLALKPDLVRDHHNTMSVDLLSLPDELLIQISTFVLVSHKYPKIRISSPRSRFTYEDPPSQATPKTTKLRKPRKEYKPTTTSSKKPAFPVKSSSPSQYTRSRARAALPQRLYDPYKTRTSVSYLYVCQHLRALATPIYYSSHAWEIGLHNREPTIYTFRGFLDAIGPISSSSIRSVIVLTRFGYNCLWEGLPSGWIRQLRRCRGLRVVWVLMSLCWVRGLESRGDNWSEKLAEMWQRKGLEGVIEVRPWSLGLQGLRALGGKSLPETIQLQLENALGTGHEEDETKNNMSG